MHTHSMNNSNMNMKKRGLFGGQTDGYSRVPGSSVRKPPTHENISNMNVKKGAYFDAFRRSRRRGRRRGDVAEHPMVLPRSQEGDQVNRQGQGCPSALFFAKCSHQR